MANSAVFNFWWNAGSDWISLTEVGREFQVRDPAAGNAGSPMVFAKKRVSKQLHNFNFVKHYD